MLDSGQHAFDAMKNVKRREKVERDKNTLIVEVHWGPSGICRQGSVVTASVCLLLMLTYFFGTEAEKHFKLCRIVSN